MLYIFERVIFPCLQIAPQFVSDGIEHGRTTTVVVKGAKAVKTLRFKQAQPIGDGIPAHVAEPGDLAVLLAEILELNAQKAPEDFGISLVLLQRAEFLLLRWREMDAESHEEKEEGIPMIQFEIIKSN
jgi:hypothetical protein